MRLDVGATGATGSAAVIDTVGHHHLCDIRSRIAADDDEAASSDDLLAVLVESAYCLVPFTTVV